jgi:hypothetical protein
MARILVMPAEASGIAPYEVTGMTLTSKVFDGEKIYYIGGLSFPESIVTVIDIDSADRIKIKDREDVLING